MKHKHFYVVTYDIGDDKRRNKVVKLMESIGTRMNFSVFECMLTDTQYCNMCKQLEKLIVHREDWINVYPLCTECYARITYIPDIKKKEPVKIVVF
jgi:CRISPR-associated protein Cas2